MLAVGAQSAARAWRGPDDGPDASGQLVDSAGLVQRYADGGMTTYPAERPCRAGQTGWYHGSKKGVQALVP